MNIEGNPLRSIKPAMRTAGAVQLMKYLKMRLGEEEIQESENKIDAAQGMPGASSSASRDHWDVLIREFSQGTVLDLRDKQLTDVSEKLFMQKKLTQLDLSKNPSLNFIPEDIDLLVNLKALRICGNGIQNVPKQILNMKELVTLELNQNKIDNFLDFDYKTGMPFTKQECQLNNLSYLSLNTNQIQSIPVMCKHMPSLKQLHMHQNKLTEMREVCRHDFA
jgi:Leucine-rich repeat (LRR) protein